MQSRGDEVEQGTDEVELVIRLSRVVDRRLQEMRRARAEFGEGRASSPADAAERVVLVGLQGCLRRYLDLYHK